MILCWVLISLSASWVAFTYVGYPVILALLSRLSPRHIQPGDFSPPLSVIIAVYNGETSLLQKLEATLALEYPGSVEILVASDGSNDGTCEIARAFGDRGVHLVELESRGGKESAQAAADLGEGLSESAPSSPPQAARSTIGSRRSEERCTGWDPTGLPR